MKQNSLVITSYKATADYNEKDMCIGLMPLSEMNKLDLTTIFKELHFDGCFKFDNDILSKDKI